MNLQYRIDLLIRLGQYILSDDPQWIAAKEKAAYENGWFIPEFVDLASKSIARSFLQKDTLVNWTRTGVPPNGPNQTRTVGIVMAGNIPLVGFHDFLCVFISGHKALIKPSSKDEKLIKQLVEKLQEWEPAVKEQVEFTAGMLKGCDAYIATGSNNSSRYFDFYFGKYPHIIRKNRTSVAILTGKETKKDLEKLADDVYLYFGLGCRNVTKLYVPRHYDFIPLLETFRKYNFLADHNKYKNNYDYNLAILLLNKVMYMTNGSILLAENTSFFSPISQLHYEFYDEDQQPAASLERSVEIQCIVGYDHIPFGQAQSPAINDYADGIDTLQFLCTL